MISDYPHASFKLAIDGFPSDLQVFKFRVTEALNEPYEVQLDLVSERAGLDLDYLINRSAFLTFGDDGAGFHGQIQQVAEGDSGKRLTRYQMTLGPHIAYLAHCHNQRIFQHLSVPQIIAKVLTAHGMQSDAWRFQLNGKYEPRLYCVQYEASLHFIQRLCEEEGLHFHFEHSASAHVLVFGDDQTVFTKPDVPTAYKQDTGLVAEAAVIDRFQLRLQTRPTHVSRRDYSFEHPHLQLESESRHMLPPHLEHYAYPGQFTHRDQGKRLAHRTLESYRADYRQAHGRSDQTALRSGHFLDMSEHPRVERNGLWLLTEVRHIGIQPQVLEESMIDIEPENDFSQGYRNHFVATPWDVIFRPAFNHPKPRITGNQPAVVTGPPGKEIHCDRYGRVKIQLAWDRDGEHNEHSSCWLRVATPWAHDLYGSVQIPRVGMEVLVGFNDGDPDKPHIIGCLPNASTPVPLALPADNTRSIFRSQSTPGGGGYNELRIEDRKGAEEIALRAQRDFVQLVLNDERLQVDNQRTVVVGGIASHDLRGEERRVTHGNRLTELKQDEHLTVHGSCHVQTGNHLLNAAERIHLAAGDKIVIDGGSHLTLMAGGQWLTLGPEGIFSSVAIQQGGAPASVGPAEPLVPGALALLKVSVNAVQQRRALMASRSSRCLVCEVAKA